MRVRGIGAKIAVCSAVEDFGTSCRCMTRNSKRLARLTCSVTQAPLPALNGQGSSLVSVLDLIAQADGGPDDPHD